MPTSRIRSQETLPEFSKLAIMTSVVKQANGVMGRTGLMKCLFFLKVVRGIPLPYNFQLYTYGPFDSKVLEDLQYAVSLGAIRSNLVQYPSGSGYLLEAGPEAEKVETRASKTLKTYKKSIEWVLKEFGNRNAIDLEMASTLVYIDRALHAKGSSVKISDLSKRVHDIKPHLSTDSIKSEARRLNERGLLKAVS